MDERLGKAWNDFVKVFDDTVTARIEQDQAEEDDHRQREKHSAELVHEREVGRDEFSEHLGSHFQPACLTSSRNEGAQIPGCSWEQARHAG